VVAPCENAWNQEWQFETGVIQLLQKLKPSFFSSPISGFIKPCPELLRLDEGDTTATVVRIGEFGSYSNEKRTFFARFLLDQEGTCMFGERQKKVHPPSQLSVPDTRQAPIFLQGLTDNLKNSSFSPALGP
jgi:hypothetical protein